MSKNIGISRQKFLVMGTYLFVILVHSSSVLSSLAAAVCVFIIQLLAYLVLPAAEKHAEKSWFVYLTVLFTVFFAVFIYWLFVMLPIEGIIVSALPFPDPAFVLIMIPLFLDHAKNPSQYKPKTISKLTLLFFFMILFVSFLRETLGYGTLLGFRVFPEGTEPIILLRHLAGAALLLFGFVLLSLYIYRQITRRPQLLAITEDSGIIGNQPLLQRKEVFKSLYTSLIWLLITIPIIMILYLLSVYLYPVLNAGIPFRSFDIIFAASILLQGAVIGFFYLVTGRKNPYLLSILSSSWLIPVQNIVLILPFSSTLINTPAESEPPYILFGLSVYLICMWIIMTVSTLFLRAIKRKLLFGRSPDILSGIPLFLLMASLLLMVFAGMNLIPFVLS